MAVLSTNVRLYLEANGKVYETERDSGAFLLRNDRDERGDYIHTWNVDGLTKPTEEQLNALGSEATTLENNNKVINTRTKLYGTLAEQLEYIVENGVDAFITKQQQIKSDNPKE